MGMVVGTLEEGLDCVRWYAARGYYQLKIYNSVDPGWVPALAAEAHRLGMRVAGHVPAFTTADRMVEAGYDEVTHINQLMLGWLLQEGEDTRTPLRLTAMTRAVELDLESLPVRRTVELLQRRGASLDTTLVAFERLMLSRDGVVIAADQPYLDHTPPSYQRERRCRFVPETATSDHARYDSAFRRMLEVTSLLHAEGVKLWPGTDDGTGFTLHRELELYVDAGIPPAEVLAIATQECATHLGAGASSGSIERGKTASFVLLAGDPTEDIGAVRRVRATVHRGALYFPDEIYPALGVQPFCERPAVTGPLTR
jgi:imidazolonepropionase-like amidohydrolase